MKNVINLTMDYLKKQQSPKDSDRTQNNNNQSYVEISPPIHNFHKVSSSVLRSQQVKTTLLERSPTELEYFSQES